MKPQVKKIKGYIFKDQLLIHWSPTNDGDVFMPVYLKKDYPTMLPVEVIIKITNKKNVKM